MIECVATVKCKCGIHDVVFWRKYEGKQTELVNDFAICPKCKTMYATRKLKEIKK